MRPLPASNTSQLSDEPLFSRFNGVVNAVDFRPQAGLRPTTAPNHPGGRRVIRRTVAKRSVRRQTKVDT